MEEGGDIGKRACLVMQLRDEVGTARNRQRPWFAGGAAAQPNAWFGFARRAQRAHLLAGELVHRLSIGRYLGKIRAQGPGPGLGGRAAGVLFDAFFVRMTLVPASMFLMGRATWWMPKWLDKILPTVDIEGTALEEEWEAKAREEEEEKE